MLNYKFHLFTGTPRGAVYGFKVAQAFKRTNRPVWNCYIKEHFARQLPHYHLPTQSDIASKLYTIASSSGETIFVQFDFMAYYDQFGLDALVSALFCFLGHDGLTYALSRLPMGFTLACAIAQATTWQLLNFERRSTVFTCIDNVAFAGTVDQVVHDVTMFLSRCQTVSATLNELSAESISSFLSATEATQRDLVRSWHKNSFTFLGVAYDWKRKTRALSEKTIEKLSATRDCLTSMKDTIQPRQLAAVVGLLRYANHILRLDSYRYYYTLDWIRKVSSLLQSDLQLWDSADIRLPAPHRLALLSWFDSVLTPRSIPIDDPLPSTPPCTLIVDACASGWGAILHLQGETSFRAISGRWESEIASSVTSEPAAVAEGAVHFFPHEAPPLVFIASDHSPLVFASYSSAPRAPPYNALLYYLSMRYPKTRFVLGHIPGHLNVTDSLSREGIADSVSLDQVRDVTGMGWDFALSSLKPKPCLSCSPSSLPWQC